MAQSRRGIPSTGRDLLQRGTSADPESAPNSYTLPGFMFGGVSPDVEMKYCLEQKDPFSPGETDSVAIQNNILVLFRMLSFYKEFSDADNFKEIVAKDMGWRVGVCERIIRRYVKARQVLVQGKDHGGAYIPTNASPAIRTMCRLVDEFSRHVPQLFTMTTRRADRIHNIRDVWMKKFKNAPLSLLISAPKHPKQTLKVDWVPQQATPHEPPPPQTVFSAIRPDTVPVVADGPLRKSKRKSILAPRAGQTNRGGQRAMRAMAPPPPSRAKEERRQTRAENRRRRQVEQRDARVEKRNTRKLQLSGAALLRLDEYIQGSNHPSPDTPRAEQGDYLDPLDF